MTSEEMEKVLHAYNEGKIIEYYNFEQSEWFKLGNDIMVYIRNNYSLRIKPESKYHPYTSSEEFLTDSEKHGRFLTHGDDFYNPICIGYEGIDIMWIMEDGGIHREHLSYKDVFDTFVWKDGTRCGVLENIKEI